MDSGPSSVTNNRLNSHLLESDDLASVLDSALVTHMILKGHAALFASFLSFT